MSRGGPCDADASGDSPPLRCDGVTVRFDRGGPAAIESISFDLAPSDRVALVGLNGSGKTTLLMALVGLVPHEGTIAVDGIRLSTATVGAVRDRVGFLFNVPEDQLLFPSVVEDVAFGLRRRGLPRGQAVARAAQALESFGIADRAHRSPHQLSHGEKQRVALAGALVTRPRLLLLDEPSAALDPPAKRELAGLLAGFEGAMLVATHDLAFAARCCDRLLVLEAGRLVHDGSDLAEPARRWGMGSGD